VGEHTTRYTHGHEQPTLASHATRTAASSAAYLLPLLSPGMHVLDVGCGPGTITLDLAALVAPGRVIGLDSVEAPLLTARASAAQRGDTVTEFRTGDVYGLPYDDDTFDVVHAHQALQHLRDPAAALREMARVCRPGGWVAARDADYAAMSWHPDLPGLEEWRRVYRAAALTNGAQPDAARHLRAWAAAAGLDDVRLTASVWTYADDDACRWWGSSQADRVSGEVFVSQAAEQGLDAADVAQLADAWRAWGVAPDAWFTIVHGELLARL
jgi:ubiquinone/menaquinone biosynthesis C-methylase UbiE